jgi:DNA-binding HxlR family transcriptional regulator
MAETDRLMAFPPPKFMAAFFEDQSLRADPHRMNATIKRHKTYDRLGCPVEVTTEIIGGKWKGKIIYILLSGKKRFGELRQLVGTATQRMLTVQLRGLERDRVVARKVYVEAPRKVEYSLTKRGRDLKPAIEAMWLWGKAVQESLDVEANRMTKAYKPRSLPDTTPHEGVSQVRIAQEMRR